MFQVFQSENGKPDLIGVNQIPPVDIIEDELRFITKKDSHGIVIFIILGMVFVLVVLVFYLVGYFS